eukprot:53131-Prymnesium_polylepis.1
MGCRLTCMWSGKVIGCEGQQLCMRRFGLGAYPPPWLAVMAQATSTTSPTAISGRQLGLAAS